MTEIHPGIAIADPTAETTARDADYKVSTVLISENPLLQAGLEHLLADTRFIVSGAARVGAPEFLAEQASLFVIVSKLCSQKVVEVVGDIRTSSPGAKICVMADEFSLNSALRAYEAGANGFCLTTVERKLLTTSLDLIMLGEGILPSGLLLSALDQAARQADQAEEPSFVVKDQAQDAIRAAGPTGQRLSAREGEILRGLMEGAPNKVIARQFGLSEATVKVHVKAILRKIGAKNRTQAAMWAADHIPPSRMTSLS